MVEQRWKEEVAKLDRRDGMASMVSRMSRRGI